MTQCGILGAFSAAPFQMGTQGFRFHPLEHRASKRRGRWSVIQDILRAKLRVAYLAPSHFTGEPVTDPTTYQGRLGNMGFPSVQEDQTE